MDENSKKTALRETLQSLRTPGELYVSDKASVCGMQSGDF